MLAAVLTAVRGVTKIPDSNRYRYLGRFQSRLTAPGLPTPTSTAGHNRFRGFHMMLVLNKGVKSGR